MELEVRQLQSAMDKLEGRVRSLHATQDLMAAQMESLAARHAAGAAGAQGQPDTGPGMPMHKEGTFRSEPRRFVPHRRSCLHHLHRLYKEVTQTGPGSACCSGLPCSCVI